MHVKTSTKTLTKIIDSFAVVANCIIVCYQIVTPPSDPPPTVSFFSLITTTEPPWANAC